jgi:serine/threonine-protein kinase HipA
MDHGAQTDVDLCELWSRIVFNILVSNTDDHLRNHGFILVPGKGWRLSEA